MRESVLAMAREFVLARNLGIVSDEGGPIRLPLGGLFAELDRRG